MSKIFEHQEEEEFLKKVNIKKKKAMMKLKITLNVGVQKPEKCSRRSQRGMSLSKFLFEFSTFENTQKKGGNWWGNCEIPHMAVIYWLKRLNHRKKIRGTERCFDGGAEGRYNASQMIDESTLQRIF